MQAKTSPEGHRPLARSGGGGRRTFSSHGGRVDLSAMVLELKKQPFQGIDSICQKNQVDGSKQSAQSFDISGFGPIECRLASCKEICH
jgi:hypothetical protein